MKTNWDLSPLREGADFATKRKAWRKATDDFIAKWKHREDYLKDSTVLLEALDDYEAWSRDYGAAHDELYYYWLSSNLDQSDTTIRAKMAKVEDFAKEIGTDMDFFTLRLSRIEPEKQQQFLQDETLATYRHFLERLFVFSSHLLSEEGEKIMTLKATSARGAWKQMVSSLLSEQERSVLDEKGKTVTKNFSELMSLLSSPHKKVRDSAALAVHDIVKTYAPIAEHELNALLGDKKVNDSLRKYSRPDAARHLSDDIPSEVVDALVASVRGANAIAHRYYALKAQLLGVKKLAYHERNVEIGSEGRTYPFVQAVSIVKKSLGDLDSEFADIFSEFLSKGRIDALPKKGKRQGAFCVYFLKSQPVYVMLNHTDMLNDVLTIAHEMGHAINDELIKQKQHALDYGTPLSTAEVASTFMEDFVLEGLMKEADEETRLHLLMQKLNSDVSSIFRQVSCYAFEQELHKRFREEGYLSHEQIGKLFQEFMASYMGEVVEQSPGSENWWVYWSHIRNHFYNYSYSSGLLISKYLQKRVREDPTFISEVKTFLSSGLSASPQEIFGKMGIDMSDPTFWKQGVGEVEALLDEAEALATKLGKIPN